MSAEVFSSSELFGSGRNLDRRTRKQASTKNIKYTRLPPSILLSFENANMDENAAGPMARAIEVVVWLRPFIVPSECLFGAVLVMNTLMAAKGVVSEN